MSYISIITLAEAKNYLRIDDDLTVDDVFIEAIIDSSLSYVERKVNHILFARSKSYIFDECGQKRVYDYPINSVTSPTSLNSDLKATYTLYERTNAEDTTLVLNVGYSSVSDVPNVFKTYALYLIDYYYYGKEGAEKESDVIPMWLENTVNQYKRFIF